MNALLVSWRTSLSGLITIGLGAYLLLNGQAVEGTGLITLGSGLLAARDNGVSSEEAGVKR